MIVIIASSDHLSPLYIVQPLVAIKIWLTSSFLQYECRNSGINLKHFSCGVNLHHVCTAVVLNEAAACCYSHRRQPLFHKIQVLLQGTSMFIIFLLMLLLIWRLFIPFCIILVTSRKYVNRDKYIHKSMN